MFTNENGLVFSTEIDDNAREAEDNLCLALKNQFSLPEILPEEEKSGLSKYIENEIVFRRATDEEDKNEHWDFKFISPKTGNVLKVDLTTARDPDYLEGKKLFDKTHSVKVLNLRGKTLKLASEGVEEDMKELATSLSKLFAESE
jgi:hypothetical protein